MWQRSHTAYPLPRQGHLRRCRSHAQSSETFGEEPPTCLGAGLGSCPQRQGSTLTNHRENKDSRTTSGWWPVFPSPQGKRPGLPVASQPQGPALQLVILFLASWAGFLGLEATNKGPGSANSPWQLHGQIQQQKHKTLSLD